MILKKLVDVPNNEKRVEMLLEFTTLGVENVAVENWQHLPEINQDVSWLDLGDLSSELFEGIGDFISTVLEAIGAISP